MSPRTEKQYEEIREQKKNQILEAALNCFANHGFSNSSIAELAREAKISKGLIYNYFKSKDDILKELIWDIFDELNKRLAFPTDRELTKDDMIRFINTNIEIMEEDINRSRLYFSLFTQPNIMEMFKDDMMEKMQPVIMMFIKYYTASGHENPVAMMRFVSACIDGVQMHIVLDPDNFPTEEVRKLLLKFFV